MARIVLLSLGLLVASLAAAGSSAAQNWRPPTPEMPAMPQLTEISGSWMSARSDWFSGAASAAGVAASELRVTGDRRAGSSATQVVRASAGPLPVMVWQDRNGDARADLIEIFRSGGVILQLIDADYDGTANVLRVYDASGALIREDRL